MTAALRPAHRCANCGIALLPTLRVMVMVEGLALLEKRLCRPCLDDALEPLRHRVSERV